MKNNKADSQDLFSERLDAIRSNSLKLWQKKIGLNEKRSLCMVTRAKNMAVGVYF